MIPKIPGFSGTYSTGKYKGDKGKNEKHFDFAYFILLNFKFKSKSHCSQYF